MKNTNPDFKLEIKDFKRVVSLTTGEEDLLYSMLLSAFKDGQI